VAGVVYADSGDSREPLGGVEAIEILVVYASRILDLMNAIKAVGKTTAEFQSDRLPQVKEATPPPVAPAPAPAPRSGEDDSGTVLLNVRDIEAQAIAQASAPKPAPALESMDQQTRKQHEDAKRFARLLISEIKLYNEAKVQQGRKQQGVYELLKDDIERSRQLYFERVSSSIRDSTNYFNEELVRILAEGDESALGQHPG
jgi:hypothetical protein